MTHLPYIAGAYAAALVVWLGLAGNAWRRVRLARRRLAAIDPRLHREGRGGTS